LRESAIQIIEEEKVEEKEGEWLRKETMKTQLFIATKYLQTDIIVASAMGICLKGVEQIV